MANTTSGTATFEKGFSIADIIEESYERIGMQGVSGYQLKSARRSLNIMFQEWGNRGLHYWEVNNTSLTLATNQKEYEIFRSSSFKLSTTSIPFGSFKLLSSSNLPLPSSFNCFLDTSSCILEVNVFRAISIGITSVALIFIPTSSKFPLR